MCTSTFLLSLGFYIIKMEEKVAYEYLNIYWYKAWWSRGEGQAEGELLVDFTACLN